VCAGPFKFVERVAQGKIVLERFPTTGTRRAFTSIASSSCQSPTRLARERACRSGDLQMIERVSPSDLAQLRADSRLRVAGVAELGYQQIPLNVANGRRAKTFADFRVRQALDLAIDARRSSRPSSTASTFPGTSS